jgi:hypothetical protein
MKKIFIAAGIAVLTCAGCAHKKVTVDSTQMTKNAFLTFDVGFLKEKGKKYDLDLGVTNVSDNDIIIMLNDMQCFKGTEQGILKHTFFNTGERTIDFRKGQRKHFRMVCTLSGDSDGDYKIVVSRVFDNPEGDGKTKGKLLAEKLSFTMAHDK